LALRVATKYDDIAVGWAVIVRAVSEPLARYSAASRARSLCIRLKTSSEIWRDRSGAADSHIEGGDLEVAAFLVHPRILMRSARLSRTLSVMFASPSTLR
jgi:hypothetical protein